MSLKSAKTHLPFAAVIVAGGNGRRFGAGTPKQYLPVAGKPLLRHAVDVFLAQPGLREIRIVIDPAHRALYDHAVDGLDLPPPVHGGAERQQSVSNALESLSHLDPGTPVLIHDSARPCIDHDLIGAVLGALESHDAATLAVPVADTIRQGTDARQAGHFVDRNNLWALQTPQGAKIGLLRQAHEMYRDKAFTDDTALLTAMNVPVHLVPGSRRNLKVTTPEDLMIVDALLAAQKPMTSIVGSGFDVHAFAKDKPGPLRIGGIDVPHDRALDGHSDADVVLHAITDALLGTLADGDIGSHFPPSDPQWKDKDSAHFLKHAASLIEKSGGRINHVDVTVICERPKIGPVRNDMRQSIATILSVPLARVSVKATTTEQLGFTGRGEGIAAQATTTVQYPS